MFHDARQATDRFPANQRVPGAKLDEVTCADDTLHIPTNTKAMNECSEAIQMKGFSYGSKLNKKEGELITTDRHANIHSKDEPISLKSKQQHTYDLTVEVEAQTKTNHKILYLILRIWDSKKI